MDRPDRRCKFWLQVVIELKNRRVQDIFIAVNVPGLPNIPDSLRQCARDSGGGNGEHLGGSLRQFGLLLRDLVRVNIKPLRIATASGRPLGGG